MKVALIADAHLFSSEIGGNWSEDSFLIFRDRILPGVKKAKPKAVIFLGDTLDPHSGKSDPRWPRGDEASGRFVEALKKTGITAYILRGNHDYIEPLKNISEMGGAKFIDDEWLRIEGTAFYFFSSRYPNLKKAVEDLDSIPDVEAQTKVLLMHENLSITGADNIPKDAVERLSKRFHMILNGHQHAYANPYDDVWCLSSALPWRPGYENSDIQIIWDQDGPKTTANEKRFGFYILNPDKMGLGFVPVDLGINIAAVRLVFSGDSAAAARERLEELSKLLSGVSDPGKTIARVYMQGTLKEGDERIDVGLSEIENKYYSAFYEGKSRNILRVEDLKGGGAYLNKNDLRYMSVEDALRQLESDLPKIRDFYEEVYDLIEKKTFDGEALVERIKNSRILGDSE